MVGALGLAVEDLLPEPPPREVLAVEEAAEPLLDLEVVGEPHPGPDGQGEGEQSEGRPPGLEPHRRSLRPQLVNASEAGPPRPRRWRAPITTGRGASFKDQDAPNVAA